MAVKRKKRKLVADIPPTWDERMQEAEDALVAASQLYRDAVAGGVASEIRTARRALQIAISNYIRVMADEPEPEE